MRSRIARFTRAIANSHIFTKLIAVYAIIMLVPTLGIAFAASRSVQASVSREVEESYRHVVRQVAANIGTRLDVARNVGQSIAFNHRVRSFLTIPFSMNAYTLNVYMNQVALLVNNALSFHTGNLYKATIYMENETIPEHWRMFLHASRLEVLPWYQEFIASEVSVGHVYPNVADHVPLHGDRDHRRVLTWIQRIHTVDGKYLGIVTLDILERDVFEPLHEASDVDRRFVIVNGAGDAVYGPSGSVVGAGIPGALTIIEPIPGLGLSVRADLPLASLTQRTARAARTMVLLTLVGFALSVGLAFVVLRIMFGKVNTMIAAMHTVAGGDLSVRVPVGGNDELGQMARDFNYLIERINALVNRVVIEERGKQEAQLAALQYQINPHFVYNTIDLFRMTLELDGAYETADAITSFGKMVRYTMAGDTMYAPLEAELDHVRNFVALQRIRHGDRIRLDITRPPDILGRRIMKLVLQPIVENCVIHGMPADGSPLTIRIRVSPQGSDTIVRITDDGVGIPKERLHALLRSVSCREMTFSAHDRTSTGIGLANIAGRLRLFYGSSSSFEICSDHRTGTTVTVTFPEPNG